MRACPPDRRNRPRRPRCAPRALTASSVVGDFALHEAVRGRVIGVSDPHVVQFPPNQPCASHDARGAGAQNADHLAE